MPKIYNPKTYYSRFPKIVVLFQLNAASARPVISNVFLLDMTISTGQRYSIHRAQTRINRGLLECTEIGKFSAKVFSCKGEEDEVEEESELRETFLPLLLGLVVV
jgi:hypothetical protein